MASYRGHLMFSAPLGAAYGAVALFQPEWDWAPILLGTGFCTVGGLLPDLDSDSGVPVRELFGIVAAAFSCVLYFFLFRRVRLSPDHALVIAGGAYFFIRYVVAEAFRRITVHRGMYHSIPAMFVSGLVIFLLFPTEDVTLKLYLAGGTMLGFLSHLVLDEIYSVDFSGVAIRLNRYAGSALKFTSKSYAATITCYVILLVLAYFAWEGGLPDGLHPRHWRRPPWMGGPPAAAAQKLP